MRSQAKLVQRVTRSRRKNSEVPSETSATCDEESTIRTVRSQAKLVQRATCDEDSTMQNVLGETNGREIEEEITCGISHLHNPIDEIELDLHDDTDWDQCDRNPCSTRYHQL